MHSGSFKLCKSFCGRNVSLVAKLACISSTLPSSWQWNSFLHTESGRSGVLLILNLGQFIYIHSLMTIQSNMATCKHGKTTTHAPTVKKPRTCQQSTEQASPRIQKLGDGDLLVHIWLAGVFRYTWSFFPAPQRNHTIPHRSPDTWGILGKSSSQVGFNELPATQATHAPRFLSTKQAGHFVTRAPAMPRSPEQFRVNLPTMKLIR